MRSDVSNLILLKSDIVVVRFHFFYFFSFFSQETGLLGCTDPGNATINLFRFQEKKQKCFPIWGKSSKKKRSQSPVSRARTLRHVWMTQVCSKGHQGSSVDHPCQPSFHWIKFWHTQNPLPESIRLRLSVTVLVRYWAGQGE